MGRVGSTCACNCCDFSYILQESRDTLQGLKRNMSTSCNIMTMIYLGSSVNCDSEFRILVILNLVTLTILTMVSTCV